MYLDFDASEKIENGKIYNVNFNEIITEMPENSNFIIDLERFKFFNPRFLTSNKENPFGVGFEPEYMDSQRESIINSGLINPFIGRIVEIDGQKKIQLVDGHRRKENINILIEKNIECFDANSNDFVEAKKLYKKVPIKIYENLSDYDAFAIAFDEEKTKIKFGHEAEIRFLLFCRRMDVKEQKIINCLGKSLSWYNNVVSFVEKLEADDETLEALLAGEINQSVAKKLAEINDLEIRHKVLDKSKEISKTKDKVKKEKTETGIIKALEKKEVLLAQKAEAEFFEDEETAEQTEEEIQSVEKEIQDKKEKNKSLKPKKVNTKDVKEAIKDLDLEEKYADKHDSSKIDVKNLKADWIEPLKDLQFNNGKDVNGDVLVKNLDFLDAMIDMLNCIASHSGDLNTFLMNWGSKIN